MLHRVNLGGHARFRQRQIPLLRHAFPLLSGKAALPRLFWQEDSGQGPRPLHGECGNSPMGSLDLVFSSHFEYPLSPRGWLLAVWREILFAWVMHHVRLFLPGASRLASLRSARGEVDRQVNSPVCPEWGKPPRSRMTGPRVGVLTRLVINDSGGFRRGSSPAVF